MVRPKANRLDPLDIKRVMDVGGPSALKKAHKPDKSKTDKDKLTGKSTILIKEPKNSLRSRLRVESDISTSENSESELTSIWEGNKTPPSEVHIHNQNRLEPRLSPLWHARQAIRTSLLLQTCTVPKVELKLLG
jgi:hypothetical protein